MCEGPTGRKIQILLGTQTYLHFYCYDVLLICQLFIFLYVHLDLSLLCLEFVLPFLFYRWAQICSFTLDFEVYKADPTIADPCPESVWVHFLNSIDFIYILSAYFWKVLNLSWFASLGCDKTMHKQLEEERVH